MGTLVKPVIRFASYLASTGSTLWFVAMLCDRLYALQLTYREAAAERANEEWLRKSCRDPVFYSNIKGHTDVCALVERNAMRNLLLFALRQVLQDTHVCGTTSCTEQAAAAVSWFLQLSAPLMLLASAMAVLCPLVLVQLVRAVAEALRPQQHVAGGYYSVPLQATLEAPPVYRMLCYDSSEDSSAPRKKRV